MASKDSSISTISQIKLKKKENPEKETHNPLPIIPFHNIPPFLHNVITDRDSEKPDE